ncbi:unnamed protein product [Fraxinus pennsylvanica]|uniref:RRM domain-containing protein n=1 Tax=Fraxinus pennsylvanica TaxID=56036 RepID=A0AAD1YPL2_9LAMI|nr:unnamed protein product [Fraxinus pennsylvanica]
MAAPFRVIYFPSTVLHLSYSYTHQFLCPSQARHPNSTSLLSLSTSHLLSQTIHSKRPNFYLFHLASSAQAHPIVQEFTPEEQESEMVRVVDVSNTRLLAQNVPWTCTADDLRPLFEQYGTVVEIELSMYDKTRNRGLAFVTMGSHEEALAVITHLESYEFEGRVLKLNWAKPKKSNPSTPPTPKPMPVHNLFVANLPFQARAKDLKDFFNADNGNVVSAEIIFIDNPRRSAGYGFVSFNTKVEAESALLAFQGKEFMGRPIRVARSRRFLRQLTKANIQSGNAKIVSNSAE